MVAQLWKTHFIEDIIIIIGDTLYNAHFGNPPNYDITMDLIQIPTVLITWIEHGEFVHYWLCTH